MVAQILTQNEMQNKVIAVSGGASGIGAEVSARVVVADLNAGAFGIACDITSPEQCEAAVEAAIKKFGRLDGMVNCAGISKPHDSLTLPPADWARMVDVQLN